MTGSNFQSKDTPSTAFLLIFDSLLGLIYDIAYYT